MTLLFHRKGNRESRCETQKFSCQINIDDMFKNISAVSTPEMTTLRWSRTLILPIMFTKTSCVSRATPLLQSPE